MTADAAQSPVAVLEPARARAIAKYVHMSPTKVRRVVAMIKGRPVAEALDILRFTPHAAARNRRQPSWTGFRDLTSRGGA